MRNTLFSLLIQVFFYSVAFSLDWNYQNQDKWIIESGKFQSPININSAYAEKKNHLHKLNLQYEDRIISVQDTGHEIKAFLSGSALINNRPFKLIQTHFHIPGEHQLDSKSYAMEAHFVHLSEVGRYAAIGVFFEIGKENPAIEAIIQSFKKNTTCTINKTAPIKNLLPKNLSYYHYLGSFTVPPLSENVEWYILKTPVSVSQDQLNKMKAFYNNNSRKLQNLSGRPILSKD